MTKKVYVLAGDFDHPLEGPFFLGDKPLPKKCETCNRNPARVNDAPLDKECSHVDCPYRKAWRDDRR